MVPKEMLPHLETASYRENIVIFHGPEGSGKSTQAQYFADAHNLPLIVVGDEMRRVRDTDMTEVGDMCRTDMATKGYLSAETFERILVPKLQEPTYAHGVVFDGLIRTREQIERVPHIFNAANLDLPVTVFYLRIPGWESVRRLQNRGREDDTEEVILRRLTRHFTGLGENMTLVKKQWRFEQVNVMHMTQEEMKEEITRRSMQYVQ